jgi:hypothetical protein
MVTIADESTILVCCGLPNSNVVKLFKSIFHLLKPDYWVILQILPDTLALVVDGKLKPVFLFSERHSQITMLLNNLGVVVLDEGSKDVSLFA